MSKLKNFGLFKCLVICITFIAFMFVFSNLGKIYIKPFQKEIDITNAVNSFQSHDGKYVVLSASKLYITDENGEVKNIVGVNSDNVLSYLDFDLCINGDEYIIYGTDNYKGTAYFAGEKMARFSENGDFLGYIFKREYSREDRQVYTPGVDIAAKDGYVYSLEENNLVVTLYRVAGDGRDLGKEPEIVCVVPVFEEVINGYIDLEGDIFYIETLFNNHYRCEISTGRAEWIEAFPANIVPDVSSVEHLSVSDSYMWKVNFYYFSLIVLSIALMYGIFCFLRSNVFSKYKIAWIISLFLLMAISMLTEEFIHLKQETEVGKLSAIADMTMMSMTSRFAGGTNDFKSFSELQHESQMMQNVLWCNQYIDKVCAEQGDEVPLYMIAYVVNRDSETLSIATSRHDAFVGKKEEDLSGKVASGEIGATVSKASYSWNDALGLVHVEDRYLYDKDGNLIFVLEVGGDSSVMEADGISSAITIVLHLMAIMAFWWVLFECIHVYKNDIIDYISSKSRRSIECRINLAGVYFFILNVILHLDYLMLVMVISYICGDINSAELALLLAFPLSAFSIGSWSGSVVTSAFINFFGERRSGIIGSIMTAVSYGMFIYACVFQDLYVLTAGKLLQGIFLESIMFSLAGGLPYEMDDEEKKRRYVVSLKDSENAASIIGIMLAGLIAQYVGYEAMYAVGVAGAFILMWLSTLMLKSSNEEYMEKRKTEHAGNAWFAFLKPKIIAYLVMIVVVYSLLAGYEGYVFPIYAEACGVSAMELSDMGVLVCMASFLGLESVLPSNEHFSPMQLMIFSFFMCGVVISMLLVNSSIFCAFIVLILLNFISRTINDYKILELTKLTGKYGYSDKDVQANFYAVEDCIRIFQAPVLGKLCSISVAVCCGVLGVISVFLPAIYGWFNIRNCDFE